MSAAKTLTSALNQRAGEKCELCGSNDDLSAFEVPSSPNNNEDAHILCCSVCAAGIESRQLDASHWACLTDSMWSQTPVVQVMSWRLLKRHASESWATEALDMMYLEDEVLAWAEAGLEEAPDDLDLKHVDSNGSQLTAGDTVVLIKDLNVKGAGFTAKRGTAVRNISLSPENASHIEGRVSGQQIVILTEFVKKS